MTRIALVGDSLSSGAASPGGQMAARLRARGHEVVVDAKVGRSYGSFLREDPDQHVAALAAAKPQVVVVALGTNDIGLASKVELERIRALRARLRDATGAPVFAFGPPSFAPGHRLLAGRDELVALERLVYGHRFLDLVPLTQDAPRTRDGVHFTAAGGEQLGARMAVVLERALAPVSKAAVVGLGLGLAALLFWPRGRLSRRELLGLRL